MTGMKESDVIRPKNEFSKRVAEIYSQIKGTAHLRYSMEDVITIYNSFVEGYRQEPVLLGHHISNIQVPFFT